MIEPLLEQSMLEGLRPSEHGPQIVLDPDRLHAIMTSLTQARTAAEAGGDAAVIACAPALRSAVHRLFAPNPGDLAVLSYLEVTSAHPTIETVGVIRALDQIAV
jgi:flagellar biosynthesis protein FlhA